MTTRGLGLPTAAQWEYACRAGTTTPHYFAADAAPRFANLADRSAQTLQAPWPLEAWDDGHPILAPVGSYAANPFGLHDVHGNVFEWCSDLFRPSYHAPGPIPQPVAAEGSRDPRRRAVRGGAWASSPDRLRSAYREFARGNAISSGIGVRPARAIQSR